MRRGAVIALALCAVAAAAAFAQGVGGLIALPPRDAAGQNVVDNGGFETRGADAAPSKWTMPRGWSVDRAAHAGAASLKLSGLAPGESASSAEQTVTLPRGSYTLEAWMKTAAVGTRSEQSGVRVCLDARPRRQWWKCSDVVRGTSEWRLIRQPLITVSEPGPYRVTLEPYGLPDGTAWIDDVALVGVGRGPLDAYLLYPNFRGMLFDDRPQTVRLALTVAERAVGGPRGASRVRVRLLDEAGAPRASREYPAAPGRLVAELDAGPLAEASYVVRAELLGADGEALSRAAEYRVVKVPAKLRERFTVWYDERNVTYLEGRPAFILGLYNTTGYADHRDYYARGDNGWGNARIAQAPMNMLINYWLGRAPMAALSTYMNDLRARGIYYLQTVNFYYADDPQYKEIAYPAARQGEEALNRYVARTLAGHRGFAGFYTADERAADAIPRVFEQYRVLRDAAPGTVAYAVLGNGWEEQAPLWRDAVDVLGLDPYPITKARGQNDLAMVGEWTRLGQDAVQGSRPVWMVLQYFPLTGAGGWPTQDELRAMSWMAIVEGAQGLLYWSFGEKGLAWVKDPREREQRWNDLVRVTREVKALEPVLLSPSVAVVASDTASGAVRSMGKRAADGTRYLFAYNTRGAPVKVTWRLSEAAGEVADLDGGTVEASGVAVTADLPPYGIRRLKIR